MILQKLGEEQGATKYQGVAKIMMAMNLQLVHNLWGAAPYSDAFTGEVLTPTYDDAQTIFQTCLTLLDEGIALINKPDPTIDLAGMNADLIHHGDAAAWVKYCTCFKGKIIESAKQDCRIQYSSLFLLNWQRLHIYGR